MPLFWNNALLAIVVITNISIRADKIFQLRESLHPVKKHIENVGKRSVVYLGLNQITIFLIKAMFAALNIHFNLLIELLLYLGLSMFILHFFAKILLETRIKKLIGK